MTCECIDAACMAQSERRAWGQPQPHTGGSVLLCPTPTPSPVRLHPLHVGTLVWSSTELCIWRPPSLWSPYLYPAMYPEPSFLPPRLRYQVTKDWNS